MSSPDSNFVRRVSESIDCSSPPEVSHREDEIPSTIELHRARLLKIDQDEARLAARGCTWYEIKASTLRESDISFIKDKAGISEVYEVVIPHVHARAHRPPAGFHTFYVNQIEMSLRFPIPKFITSLCDYLEGECYSEEENPCPFLDVERALADMSDDEDSEEGSLGRDEAPPA
ncbi:UBX domain-containing protein 6-like [Dorcoceras hygrometricum]|uniref:UBX domain-containing protein 6-like n=1 Tax=Dorcoceras hygrometricum TaxID=472368 RepID=A0A2Z7BD87_9LAMI|nr:UBX domain-containing protein 6-like [Dorcoceras hygrometricum]